jgi:hypothetical protein
MTNLEEEELIQFLSKVTMKEEERSSKLVKRKGYQISCLQESQTPELPKKGDYKEGKLSLEVKELRTQIAELREVVAKSSQPPSQRSRRSQARKCRACSDSNISVCNHCWHCGSSEHFSRGCRNRMRSRREDQPTSENGIGLLPRDGQ